jgi:23S rRNA (adenine2503-C2)-methyltransferase
MNNFLFVLLKSIFDKFQNYSNDSKLKYTNKLINEKLNYLLDKNLYRENIKSEGIEYYNYYKIFTELLKNQTYRINQLIKWIFNKYELDFEKMSDLPLELRKKLKENFATVTNLKIREVLHEKKTDTFKLKLITNDLYIVESVILNDRGRYTLCVSTQIGCPIGCKFCATGNSGFIRNLDAHEIIDQFLLASNFLKNINIENEEKNNNINNIVFMGMGEPLLNIKNVFASIETLNNPTLINLSSRKITISTSGIENKLEELFNFKIPIRISFSLHSPENIKRKEIIPINNNIDEIINKFENYYNKTRNRITIEYILIKNVNDDDNSINKLINISKKLGNFINLIQYNPVSNIDFEPTDEEKILKIKSKLEKSNINVSVRYKRGREIKGACGQLLWENLNKDKN